MEPTVSVSDSGAKIIDLTAKRKVEGIRLDQYLVTMFPDYSRSVVQRVIEAGGVVVNGKRAKASYRVRHDERIRIWLPGPTHDVPVPDDIPLEVLDEDDFLALINRP